MTNDLKCPGLSCPIKNTCDRFSRPAKKTQNYFTGPPYNWFEDKCEFYVSNGKPSWK